jgi:hypothetical protein
MVMAYRVEYPPYKIQLDEVSKVTGFKGNEDGKGINISFVKPDHSEYFSQERIDDPDLRVVTFEMKDVFWNAVRSKMGTLPKKTKVDSGWKAKIDKLKTPSWSDGKDLPKFIKQTALGFRSAWLDVLLEGVVRSQAASVYYPADDESMLKPTHVVWAWDEEGDPKDDGQEMALSEVKKAEKMTYVTLAKAKRLGYFTDD